MKPYKKLAGLAALVFLVIAITSAFHAFVTEAEQPKLIISMPSEQPSPLPVVPGSTTNEFLYFDLTASGGDVTITNMVVEQRGNAQIGAFSTVQVREIATSQDIGRAKALNGSKQMNTTYSFTIKNGETRRYRIIADMASSLSSYDGQTPNFAIVRVDSNATISGLPIAGSSRTINPNLTIGSLSLAQGPQAPGSAQSYNVGAKDKIFNSYQFTAGSAEPLYLTYMIWEQTGSVADSDIANLTTTVIYKGQKYSFPTFLYSVGSNPSHQYISLLGDTGIPIGKGETGEIYLSGDIMSGAGRTIDFANFIKVALFAIGGNYGYELFGYNVDEPAAHTITNASFTVSRSNMFQSTYNGEPKAGRININTKGEKMEISTLTISFEKEVAGVKIWNSDGLLLAGPVNSSSSGAVTFAFAEGKFIAPIGLSEYTITANTATDFNNTFTYSAKGGVTGVTKTQ